MYNTTPIQNFWIDIMNFPPLIVILPRKILNLCIESMAISLKCIISPPWLKKLPFEYKNI